MALASIRPSNLREIVETYLNNRRSNRQFPSYFAEGALDRICADFPFGDDAEAMIVEIENRTKAEKL